jgi:hypothetical protein
MGRMSAKVIGGIVGDAPRSGGGPILEIGSTDRDCE